MDQTSRSEDSSMGRSLARLREALTTSTDLMVPWETFHREFAAQPGFTGEAKVRRNEALEGCLKGAAEQLFDAHEPLRGVRLLHLADHRFWHGSGQVAPWNAVCFFFDELGVGLAGFFKSYAERRIELVRMTMSVVPVEPVAGRRSFVSWSRKVGRARA